METIAISRVVAAKLFGGKANKSYAENSQRLAVVKIRKNVEGKFIVSLGSERYVPATKHYVSTGTWDVFSAVYGNETAARAIANVLWTFGRDEMNGQGMGTDAKALKELGLVTDRDLTVCPECDHINTLNVAHESYGDRTTCTNCSYNHYYSIGD